MMSTHPDAVIDWLLDADPSIRWQVMRDLTETPAEIVAAERARVASEGWGARLLDQQRPDGQWGDGVATPFWWSNMYTLVWLRDLGLDPRASARERRSIAFATTSPGDRSSETRRSSKVRSSRASTAASSRSAPISVSAAIDSSIVCWANSSGTAAGIARRSAARSLVVPHDDLRARRTARVRAGIRRDAVGNRRAEARARVSPRAPTAPTAVDRRDHQGDVDAVRVSPALAL